MTIGGWVGGHGGWTCMEKKSHGDGRWTCMEKKSCMGMGDGDGGLCKNR